MDEKQSEALGDQPDGGAHDRGAESEPLADIPYEIVLARRIEEAPTTLQKSQLLWALPTRERHSALGALPAEVVASVIEYQPDENLALLGNLPAPKFVELVNLGPSDQGRLWLERAVTSGHLAAQILPALVQPRDLMHMLMTSPDMRRALPRLLNFNRANDMRAVLHPLEWKQSLDDLLLADAQELLQRAAIKNRAIRQVLQSLLDFYPEAYLATIRLALDRVQYEEDHPDEYEDLTQTPFAFPEFLREEPAAAAPAEDAAAPVAGQRPITEIIPAAGDPFLSLATAQLPDERRAALETELRDLLRQEIVATGSFSQQDLIRAAGRLLFQLRAGLEFAGAATPEDAARVLQTSSFQQIAQSGARVAERYRQRSLQLAGVKDWLDSRQKQFLAAMRTFEPAMEPEHNQPVFYLASAANQPRDEWAPVALPEVEAQLDGITAWVGLAKAAFTTASRVQTIFATARTRTVQEACRRTVVALCLYRRWEPELVRPAEDFAPFRRQFGDSLGRLNPARQTVLEALDQTPDAAWRPADARERARHLLLEAIDDLEKPEKPGPSARPRPPRSSE